MLKEHAQYPGFYAIPRAENYYINREAVVIRVEDGGCLSHTADNEFGIQVVRLVMNGKKEKRTVAKILADLFIPIPVEYALNKRLTVAYCDENPTNLDLDNLYWISPSDLRAARYRKVRAEIARRYLPAWETLSTSGYYPDPVECEDYPGYFFIPFSLTPVVISQSGDAINLMAEAPQPIEINHYGYAKYTLLISVDGNKGIWKPYLVSRIVAMLFLGIPDRHKDKSWAELEVNHKDAIKLNNHMDNLEWCTEAENMRHAWDNHLVPLEKRVMSRNILTNEIKTHWSATEVAGLVGTSLANISRHLLSPAAGRVTWGKCVYKYDDGRAWPDLEEHELIVDRGQSKATTYCKNVLTGETHIAPTVNAAFKTLGLSPRAARRWYDTHGKTVPFNGWIYKTITKNQG
jgi:hypothetical protein